MSATASLRRIDLHDRYRAETPKVLINGVQALVRLMLLQAEADKATDISSGGFVSGYRGSPLGGLDSAFASVQTMLDKRGIVLRPAVNEDLAATAIAGSQQVERTPGAGVSGVFSLWYGKGPGLDRASDAIRHGVQQGTSPHGGVILAVGDDHLAKSSSIVCYSDEAVAGLQVPLLYPADAREIIEFGLHSFAMSRHTGSWTALKMITEVADATRTVDGLELPFSPILPPHEYPDVDLHNRWPEMPLEQELRHVKHRLPAVAAYVYANKLDRIVLKPSGARVGLVAAGKAWLDLMEGLRLLDLDEQKLAASGVALYKPAMIWPLEARGLTEFAEGLESIVMVEEKASFVERQAKDILFNTPHAPAVWGKTGPGGAEMFPAVGDLTPERIAAELGDYLAALLDDAAVGERAASVRQVLQVQAEYAVPPQLRKPFFCSGCPHNRSTSVPEGSRAMGGIGCHGLAAYNQEQTGTFSQMGGEGVHWVGLAPFTEQAHVFANMGDGTYFHSGLLAIRQSVAAKVQITYKILYNSAVAMTGGQAVDGELSVAQLIEQVAAEGVTHIHLCTDDTARYPAGHTVRRTVSEVWHRSDLETLQRKLSQQPGVSVIVYEQMCATEKRRMRKRGKLEVPDQRVFINELVCEGCGDCSVKSNCLSVEPVSTPFGTKRRINQTSCNMDFGCLDGFCPSLVTVSGGTLIKGDSSAADIDVNTLPTPLLTHAAHQRIVVAGVGGTGIVTIGALMAMATHLSGRGAGVLDQTGMAQKGGAVMSHIHLADDPITALRIPPAEADLVIACDQVVANLRDVITAIDPTRTRVLINEDVGITGDFTRDRDAIPNAASLENRLRGRAGAEHLVAYPFTRMAERLLGDALGSNMMMVGFCWQKGWLDIDLAALNAALDINAASVAMNKAALAWGRQLAVDEAVVFAACRLEDTEEPGIDEIIARRKAHLANYQNSAYAERYGERVQAIRAVEERVGGDGRLTEAVARSLFQVMAYKDEYEVARLYCDDQFAQSVRDNFSGDVSIKYYMAPPILARRDQTTGHLRKMAFGGWMKLGYRLLAAGRGLRGSVVDPFGYSQERRDERALIKEYNTLLDEISAALTPDNCARGAELAAMVQQVRGFGHVKAAALAQYKADLPKALARFKSELTVIQDREKTS